MKKQQPAVRCCEMQVFKSEKSINLDGCRVEDIRAEIIRTSLKMSSQTSKQTFSKNINEHLISSGNALADTVTVIILQKFYEKCVVLLRYCLKGIWW